MATTTTTAPTTAPTLDHLDCRFSGPAAVRGPGSADLVCRFSGPAAVRGPGSADLDCGFSGPAAVPGSGVGGRARTHFYSISVSTHKFLSDSSVHPQISLGFQCPPTHPPMPTNLLEISVSTHQFIRDFSVHPHISFGISVYTHKSSTLFAFRFPFQPTQLFLFFLVSIR